MNLRESLGMGFLWFFTAIILILGAFASLMYAGWRRVRGREDEF